MSQIEPPAPGNGLHPPSEVKTGKGLDTRAALVPGPSCGSELMTGIDGRSVGSAAMAMVWSRRADAAGPIGESAAGRPSSTKQPSPGGRASGAYGRVEARLARAAVGGSPPSAVTTRGTAPGLRAQPTRNTTVTSRRSSVSGAVPGRAERVARGWCASEPHRRPLGPSKPSVRAQGGGHLLSSSTALQPSSLSRQKRLVWRKG